MPLLTSGTLQWFSKSMSATVSQRTKLTVALSSHLHSSDDLCLTFLSVAMWFGWLSSYLVWVPHPGRAWVFDCGVQTPSESLWGGCCGSGHCGPPGWPAAGSPYPHSGILQHRKARGQSEHQQPNKQHLSCVSMSWTWPAPLSLCVWLMTLGERKRKPQE